METTEPIRKFNLSTDFLLRSGTLEIEGILPPGSDLNMMRGPVEITLVATPMEIRSTIFGDGTRDHMTRVQISMTVVRGAPRPHSPPSDRGIKPEEVA